MAKKTVVVAYCPECDGDKAADIMGEHSETFNSPVYDSNTLYRILKCRGCNHVHFQTASTNSEDIEHYVDPDTNEDDYEHVETLRYFPPKPKRPRPDWTISHSSYSPAMEHLLDEAYDALNDDLPVLAAIALRTVFDAATEVLGIKADLSFKKKLDELEAHGHINKAQKDILNALTDAGNAAAHRGWRPTDKELDTMFTIMETFLRQAFVLSIEQQELTKRADELRKRTPQRPPAPKSLTT